MRATYIGRMETQNLIKRRLSEPVTLERIRHLVESGEAVHRTDLARRLCDELDLRDRRGRLQVCGCGLALTALEKKGLVRLPALASPGSRRRQPQRLGQPVPAAEGVPDEVGSVGGLRLVEVRDAGMLRVWNEMMCREHPLKHGPLVGRQIRYLIGSEHGWLGGFGFAAAALQMADRDRWIGWDAEGRRQLLENVVCMNRFLVRPGIACANLASHVLALCVRTLPADFERRYGYRPLLLESFVDPADHAGTCYKAANWVRVGQTKGRGRYDRHTRCERTRKDIYVYPLVEDFRQRLGLPPAGVQPLDLTAGMDEQQWAQNEFGGAALGDRRLSARLVEMAAGKGAHPTASWTQIAGGDRAATKACYRLLSQPDDSPLTLEAMLLPHRQQTLRRMAAQTTVLCIHDTTDLNYAGLAACSGLGVIGKNQTTTESRGLQLHSTLAATGEGLPLGILRAACRAPELKPERKGKDRRNLPIEEKDTLRWIEGLRDSQDVAATLPGVRVINVMDREADFFDMFDQWRRNPRGELLVRALHDRSTTGEASMFQTVRSVPPQAVLQIAVPRHSARPAKGKRPATASTPARTAEVELRFVAVTIRPPKLGVNRAKDPIALTLIHIVEPHPPRGVKPLEWFLLTTMRVDSVKQAEQCVAWYCRRWRIEEWHRVLKSGCRAEDAANRTPVRLQRVVAIGMVVAWRIMLMTLLGREVPELPADVFFTDLEMRVLRRYAKKTA